MYDSKVFELSVKINCLFLSIIMYSKLNPQHFKIINIKKLYKYFSIDCLLGVKHLKSRYN